MATPSREFAPSPVTRSPESSTLAPDSMDSVWPLTPVRVLAESFAPAASVTLSSRVTVSAVNVKDEPARRKPPAPSTAPQPAAVTPVANSTGPAEFTL